MRVNITKNMKLKERNNNDKTRITKHTNRFDIFPIAMFVDNVNAKHINEAVIPSSFWKF